MLHTFSFVNILIFSPIKILQGTYLSSSIKNHLGYLFGYKNVVILPLTNQDEFSTKMSHLCTPLIVRLPIYKIMHTKKKNCLSFCHIYQNYPLALIFAASLEHTVLLIIIHYHHSTCHNKKWCAHKPISENI